MAIIFKDLQLLSVIILIGESWFIRYLQFLMGIRLMLIRTLQGRKLLQDCRTGCKGTCFFSACLIFCMLANGCYLTFCYVQRKRYIYRSTIDLFWCCFWFNILWLVSSIHPPPAFGSSTNLEALALEVSKSQGQDHDSTSDNGRSLYRYSCF